MITNRPHYRQIKLEILIKTTSNLIKLNLIKMAGSKDFSPFFKEEKTGEKGLEEREIKRFNTSILVSGLGQYDDAMDPRVFLSIEFEEEFVYEENFTIHNIRPQAIESISVKEI